MSLESPDPYLKEVLKEMSYCCGWFARNPQNIKDAAYQALGAYNIFYVQEEKEISPEDFALLFTTIKFLGSHNSIERKRKFMVDYWTGLQARLLDLGIRWTDQSKPN